MSKDAPFPGDSSEFELELARFLERNESFDYPPRDEDQLDRLLDLASIDASLPDGFLARLRERLEFEFDMGGELYELLDELHEPRVPVDLAQRVTAGVREGSHGNEALDALLERVHEPTTPPGLVERVRARVAAEAHPHRSWRRHAPLFAAAAAVLLLALGGRILRQQQPPDSPTSIDWTSKSEGSTDFEMDPLDRELLAHLTVLEDWDVLTDPDYLLSDLDAFDRALLEFETVGEGSGPAEEPR